MTSTQLPERDAWLALASVDGVGERILGRFVRAFGSAAETLAIAADRDAGRALRRLMGAAPHHLRLVAAGRVRAAAMDPAAITRRLAAMHAWAVTPLDAGYPSRLRLLDPPPIAIFGMGDLDQVGRPRSVSVVGTRHPTPHGRATAARIARRLTDADAAVISGLAVGIDGAAHAATVEVGGCTVAVIGGGFDHAGPRAHDRLRSAIVGAGGAIISEHPPHIAPSRGTFPRRNRIISALALATIVVEAPVRSGALITARHALEQGRPLLVVPGRPGDPAAAGCLALLRETPARPLIGLDEMIVDLGLDAAPAHRRPGHPSSVLGYEAAIALLGPVERTVAQALHAGPVTIDALVTRTGLPPPVVAGALTLLQLRGWTHPLGALQLPAGPLLASPAQPARVVR